MATDQIHAWNDVKDVVKPAGWYKTGGCDECGGVLFAVPGVNGLGKGQMRVACKDCMQRYNVTPAPPAPAAEYTDFGSF